MQQLHRNLHRLAMHQVARTLHTRYHRRSHIYHVIDSICVFQFTISRIQSMRCDDNVLLDYFIKNVSNRIGAKSIITTVPNKITLNNPVETREIIEAMMQYVSNNTTVVLINFLMTFIDFDLYFVEDRFSSDKKVSCLRICAPNNSGSTINFHGKITIRKQPIQRSQITRQDRIFGVLEMCVFSCS